MSFIKNMFGGGAAPKKPDPVQQKKIESERSNLDKEKAKEKLEDAAKKTDLKIDKINEEIGALESEVKQLIVQKRKDKATVVLKKLKQKKEMVVRLQKQANMLNKQMGLMEDTEQDMDLFEVMKDANKVNQKNRDQQDQLTDELMKAKELEQEAGQRRQELNDLMDDDEDQDDLDDMMKEYEKEANEEIKLGFDKADKKILSGDKTKAQTQPVQQKKQQDNFDSMLADLMN